MEGIQCCGFTFYNEFDSANLAKVVYVPPNESTVISITNTTTNSAKNPPEIPDAEFNLWTKPDCCGTEYENGNRTWFYFGLKSHQSCMLVRLNIVDLNRQGKMYSQGMAPVFRIIPGKMQWERIRDKPIHNTIDDIFTLSFKYKTPENTQSITYFAFTYPFSYADLQKMLINIDLKFQNSTLATSEDDIYYTKELLCKSLGGKEVSLITISSYYGMISERETYLKNLFPTKQQRPFKFPTKKIIFISARVHPGETPSTFVFNGLLNLLLTRDDPVAIILRRLYVFKMIPFLNPDGVSLGHYRTDTRGVNLNRVYLNPSFNLHPPVYAARSLIRYYHYGYEKEDVLLVGGDSSATKITKTNDNISMKVSHMSLEENINNTTNDDGNFWCIKCKTIIIFKMDNNGVVDGNLGGDMCRRCKSATELVNVDSTEIYDDAIDFNESGLFLYVDLHGHASKKGIFMYGNHFQDLERNVECMLLPKLMSINNHNFHFTACNFTERNMYLRDRRDGMSREGSGRVAVLKLTGLTKSYTLECNYNTGRIVNNLPSTIKESQGKMHTLSVPPKYTPHIFEEVGKSLGASILDLTGQNPLTRLPHSEFHSLSGLKDWLRLNCAKDMLDNDATTSINNKRPKTGGKFRNLAGLHNQGKSTGHATGLLPMKRIANRTNRPNTAPIERKENIVHQQQQQQQQQQPCCSYSNNNNNREPQRVKSSNFRSFKSKNRKEFTHKFINKTRNNGGGGDKTKLISRNKLKATAQKNQLKEERGKLKEICFMKSGDKFKEDNGWKASSSSEIFVKINKTKKGNVQDEDEGGSKSTTFLHFSKNPTFPKCIFKKHTLLRRLAKNGGGGGGGVGNDSNKGVVEKVVKKRKKMKSK